MAGTAAVLELLLWATFPCCSMWTWSRILSSGRGYLHWYKQVCTTPPHILHFHCGIQQAEHCCPLCCYYQTQDRLALTRAGSSSHVAVATSGLDPAHLPRGKCFLYVQTATCGHFPLCPVPSTCPSSGRPLGTEQAGGDESQAACHCPVC